MARDPEVLVIGGGVIGLTVAYFLAREGVAVEVVDRGDFGQEASWAGAGILPPRDPAHAADPYDLLRAHGSALFPALSAELRERTGLDNGYRRCGGLEFAVDGGLTATEWRGEGIACEELDEQGLHRLEPALAPGLARAIHLPDLAQVRNPRHLKALLAGCASCGVKLRPGCPVHAFERQGERITGLQTGVGRLAAGRFVVAAGAWSDALLEQVGFRPGIHPVRGQIALLNTAAPLVQRVLCQGKRYLVPRPDGRVLVGSTEEDAGFDKRTTAGAIADLLRFACSLVPRLASAPVERCWAGLRPGSPDEMPFLGPVPGCDNLFVAAGHYRAGIQLSPVTGLVMKELLLGQPLTVPLGPFRLDRAAFR
ncbi:MAG TPA: glycine oxidase ThiO [Gemmataceae bacterium]|nr:glycine oxidase ThiO [Gemmataceae bacterium]